MKELTAIIIGAGGRGQMYAHQMKAHGRFKVVGVAEPKALSRNEVKNLYNLSEEVCFDSWEDILAQPKMADIAVISTVDKHHYLPALAAIDKGYDLLLEKPVAPTAKECADIANAAKEKGCKILVCHVLRYTPFFMKIKEMISKGAIGKVLSVHHCECVGHLHYAHSYVRGNFGNTADSSCMLLAKSCHDIDILQWLVDSECKKVSSFGTLSYFTKENAPEGAPEYCIEGCPHEKECHYSALKAYFNPDEKSWFKSKEAGAGALGVECNEEAVKKALSTTQFGKCIYKCNNDVVDHQVVNIEFTNGAVASFNMSAFNHHGRFIRVMGTEGEIYGDIDADLVKYFSFKTCEHEIIHPANMAVDSAMRGGHAGGDKGIIQTLYKYLVEGYDGELLSEIGISVYNHLITFAAEESRLEGRIVQMDEFVEKYLK